MASCVKCSNNKQFKDIITIKRNSNKKLFETLFKDVNAAHLTICKICFGEIAEFLDEDDLIEIQDDWMDWMQDDNEVVKQEVLDCEQEITKHEIFAIPLEKTTGILMQNIGHKYQKLTKKKKNLIKTVKDVENILHFEKSDDFSNTKNLNNCGNKCQQFTTEIPEPSEVTPTFVIQEDSNLLHFQTQSKYNLCNELAFNSNSEAVHLEDELKTLPIIESLNFKESIPTFEIDDDSDSSVQFVDELRFEPPQNIAEDSIESIDFKQDIDAFEIQDESSKADTDDRSLTTTTIETDTNSCGIDVQMLILNEFERQCELIEQRLAQDKQNEDPPKQTNELTNYENSISCHTLRFNTDSCDSHDEQSFICSACGQISNKIWKIQEHITLGDLKSACKNAQIEQQKLERGICCEFCSLFYRRPTDLQTHRATGIHSDLMYTCPECFQCFKEFLALNNHTKTHTMPSMKLNTVFMCNVGDCIEMCLDWPSLSKHKDRCHIAQICPICREQFHDGRFFRVHVKNCKEVKEKCKYCVKKFHNSCLQTFTTHGKNCLSFKERNVHCDKCEARFRTNSSLHKHNIMYHQPIDCRFCGKVFKNKRSLLSHIHLCPKNYGKIN